MCDVVVSTKFLFNFLEIGKLDECTSMDCSDPKQRISDVKQPYCYHWNEIKPPPTSTSRGVTEKLRTLNLDFLSRFFLFF